MSLALLYYALSARKWFKGPRINIEHTGRLPSTTTMQASRSMSEKSSHHENIPQ